ncbi:hypothetical protein MOQ_003680 [Trypanosoma cruzi marinkellei]|uniref:Uncharacterized protein n=1 Tax=Trypanosoma cruzi marinkellei TaxID=85056 RepID=K2N3F5_TRYCR|nr:hypothetical protein MOQ_003680 [Trypanosoma cruzi marinkellei]
MCVCVCLCLWKTKPHARTGEGATKITKTTTTTAATIKTTKKGLLQQQRFRQEHGRRRETKEEEDKKKRKEGDEVWKNNEAATRIHTTQLRLTIRIFFFLQNLANTHRRSYKGDIFNGEKTNSHTDTNTKKNKRNAKATDNRRLPTLQLPFPLSLLFAPLKLHWHGMLIFGRKEKKEHRTHSRNRRRLNKNQPKVKSKHTSNLLSQKNINVNNNNNNN